MIYFVHASQSGASVCSDTKRTLKSSIAIVMAIVMFLPEVINYSDLAFTWLSILGLPSAEIWGTDYMTKLVARDSDEPVGKRPNEEGHHY